MASFFSQGPFEASKVTVGTVQRPEASLKPFRATVWAPTCRAGDTCATQGEHPVLVYVSGFAGGMEIESYENLFRHVVSHGSIVVGLDKAVSLSIKYKEIGAALAGPTAWLNSEEFDSLLRDAGMSGSRRKGVKLIGGHSAGNHVLVQHLVDAKCSEYGGVIMNSPVDGADPFGITRDFITPDKGSGLKLPIVLPALHIKGGLDPLKLGSLSPSCAPEDMSNERFFEAWQGPIWKYEVADVGHMDMCGTLSDLYRNQCPGTENLVLKSDFQNLTAGLMAAFIDTVARQSQQGLETLNTNRTEAGQARWSLKTANNVEQLPKFQCTYNPVTPFPSVLVASILGAVVLISLVALWYRRARRSSEDILEMFTAPSVSQVSIEKVQPDPALLARCRPQLENIYKEAGADESRVDQVLNHFLAMEDGLEKLNKRLFEKYNRTIVIDVSDATIPQEA